MEAIRGAPHGGLDTSLGCKFGTVLDLRKEHLANAEPRMLRLVGPTIPAMASLSSALRPRLGLDKTVQQMRSPGNAGAYIPFFEVPSTLEAAVAVVLGAPDASSLQGLIRALNTARSKGGLAVCVATKPFMFEGQKRQRKAEETFNILMESAHVLLVVEHEEFLKRDNITVLEASALSTESVVLAVQAISELISPGNRSSLLNTPTSSSADTSSFEIMPVLRSCGRAAVAFGRAFSAAEAVKQACLRSSILNRAETVGPLICAIASGSRQLCRDEIRAVERVLRSRVVPDVKCICFAFQDKTLESGMSQATIIIAGACDFETGSTVDDHGSRSKACCSGIEHAAVAKVNGTRKSEESIGSGLPSNNDIWESGPSCVAAKAWAESRTSARTALQEPALSTELRISDDVQEPPICLQPLPHDPGAIPRTSVFTTSLDAMYNAASAMLKGNKRLEARRSLAERAASMLESERSEKNLAPVAEMEFGDGFYQGRCEGGLPEGKGRLTYPDGSFYEGHWTQGRKDGVGSFYYANGDMYQGSWHNDLKHGEGWLYFHTGDRLHAQFVNGKAHGAGRYYSANGSLLFGELRDNRRDGDCICIDGSGTRWLEVWRSGVLVSRKHMVM